MPAKACATCGQAFTPRNRFARFCPTHEQRSPSTAALRDPAYQQARRQMLPAPCAYCGQPADTIDHVIPVSAGGTNHRENLVPCCRSCNQRKADRATPGGPPNHQQPRRG